MMNNLHFQPVTDTVSVVCNAAVVPIMPRVCAYVPMCLCAYNAYNATCVCLCAYVPMCLCAYNATCV